VSRTGKTVIAGTLAAGVVAGVVIALVAGSSRIEVRTAAPVPPLAEGEPVRGLPARPGGHRGDARLERSALEVIRTERRGGGLAQALGAAPLKIVQVGDLNANGRGFGATLLVDLPTPRRNVRATVPAYIPATGDSGSPYTAQRVRMHVAVLRDALIDVDLRSGKVIAFEPGPRSTALSWSPSRAPAPAGAADED
jgi:hypothetical protein